MYVLSAFWTPRTKQKQKKLKGSKKNLTFQGCLRSKNISSQFKVGERGLSLSTQAGQQIRKFTKATGQHVGWQLNPRRGH